MRTMSVSTLTYLEADENLKNRVGVEWGEKSARHIHLTDGFSTVACDNRLIVGLISVYWKKLPIPLVESFDWYIDILEVHEDYRRRGVGTQLVKIACERAKGSGVYQIRAWSSEDKIEAILMWKALGFGLCPAITYPQGKEVKGYFVVKVL
jgi:ribosomal protein S18 acetylase RimI-like enzyme